MKFGSRWVLFGALVAAVLAPARLWARPVVVELFTSEACSSCPPAEALLRQLKASDPTVLPLSFHVTYWDNAAWTDKYSLAAATDRQSWYAKLQNGDLYTPEAVVDGGRSLVGSQGEAMAAAIAAARPAALLNVPIQVTDGGGVAVSIGAGKAAATAWLIGYDDEHTTQIGGGENGGATLTEVNVVRSITRLGAWQGAATSFHAARPAGMRLAVLLQRDDGVIEGVATAD